MMRRTCLAVVLLAGCSREATPPPLPCPADLVLSAAAVVNGTAVEQTPAGRCLAAQAEAHDRDAALRLGDFYREIPGKLPKIDRYGHELHWYRLAADNGSPVAAWRAASLIDNDPDRQIPNDALAYLIVAVKGRQSDASGNLVGQWQAGRIEPGRLWALRGWLNRTATLPQAQRKALIDGLDGPAAALKPE